MYLKRKSKIMTKMILVLVIFAGLITSIVGVVISNEYSSDLSVQTPRGVTVNWKLLPPLR
jgi:hypothetical protein